MDIVRCIIDACLGLLYPKRCISCDGILSKMEKEIGICRDCIKVVNLVGKNYCLKCGKSLEDSRGEYCKACKMTHHTFDQNKAVFRYDGGMKNAMYRFKYANRRCYGKVFAMHAVRNYGKWIKEKNFDVIIPVPMNDQKKRKRGYNQAEVFAREISRLTGIPINDRIVRREIDTTAMKQLNNVKRKKNLLNAFIMTENVVQFRKVLIIDDIYTTGATLDEVAKVLKSGGIKEVFGLCACIGQAK